MQLRKRMHQAVLASALTLGLLVGGMLVTGAEATLMLDLNTGGSALPCGSGCGANGTTFGWAFTVLNTITVDGLGVWDARSDGLGTSSLAGVWTNTGTLLASATVSDGSAPVASASSDGRWLFETITALTLTPGDYVIGHVFFDTLPLAQVLAPFVTIPDITGIAGRLGSFNGGLTAPLDFFDVPVFGPTLHLQDSAPVPEPATWLLLGTGLAVVVGLRARRRHGA